jgi:hypothetical membrane protein
VPGDRPRGKYRRPSADRDRLRRLLAWGGVVGPAGFVAAWAGSGAVTQGYSPVRDAISRLAATGAPTRVPMTAGFVCFGLAVPAYASALRDRVPGRAWVAAATTGVATLGVAAFPLDRSATTDAIHGGFATVGYASLALTPVLAARSLEVSGHRKSAAASAVAGMLCGAALAATVLGPAHGLFQRAGLTIGDLWLAVSALVILQGRWSGPVPLVTRKD